MPMVAQNLLETDVKDERGRVPSDEMVLSMGPHRNASDRINMAYKNGNTTAIAGMRQLVAIASVATTVRIPLLAARRSGAITQARAAATPAMKQQAMRMTAGRCEMSSSSICAVS